MSERARERVVILSRKRALYSTSRLVKAVKKAGASPWVMDTLKCDLFLSSEGAKMQYGEEWVDGASVVIPRIGASITNWGVKVVSHFAQMNVPVVASPTAIVKSRDKLRCLQELAGAGVAIPRTVMANDGSRLDKLVAAVGGLPAIIKLLRGTQGVGVMLATSLKEVSSITETFFELGQEILIQEFIAESKGRDVRALVVGDEVVGAMRRKAKRGEFRSNIHRGGEGKPIRLPKEYAAVAVRAAKTVGLGIAGVDLLEGKDGPMVMELNSSPGFEGLEKATGRDIAGAMVSYALELSRQHKAQGRPEL